MCVRTGVVISNADSSFLMATHTVIASEFDALHDSSWLLTSFVLGGAVTQPLVSEFLNLILYMKGEEESVGMWFEGFL
jgi:hypothetical protein